MSRIGVVWYKLLFFWGPCSFAFWGFFGIPFLYGLLSALMGSPWSSPLWWLGPAIIGIFLPGWLLLFSALILFRLFGVTWRFLLPDREVRLQAYGEMGRALWGEELKRGNVFLGLIAWVTWLVRDRPSERRAPWLLVLSVNGGTMVFVFLMVLFAEVVGPWAAGAVGLGTSAGATIASLFGHVTAVDQVEVERQAQFLVFALILFWVVALQAAGTYILCLRKGSSESNRGVESGK